MTEPIKASEVRASLDEDHDRRVKAAQAARSRIARAEGLRKAGVMPLSSGSLAGDLERRLRRRTGLPT